jgi:NAD(P)-dependent dehydrogenase (short-subunit alcohol dehydrogenase family)
MFSLAGKVALVAGGGGYFGEPICIGLMEQGAKVCVADIDIDRARQVAAKATEKFPGAAVYAVELDAGNEASICEVVKGCAARFGRLDILVNTTYLSIGKTVEELTADEFDRSLHLNVTGTFLLAREAVRAMEDGGSIVLFSSMYGQISPDPGVYDPPLNPNPIEYGTGKAAIEQLTRYLAVHWAKRNIRVNAIAPGPFPHAIQQSTYPEWMKKLAAKNPLGRIGRQEEMAGAVVFLASGEASYITGHILNVDGGWTVW